MSTASTQLQTSDDICRELKGPKPVWRHFHEGDEKRKLSIAKIYLLREQIAEHLGGTIAQPEDDPERHTHVVLAGVQININYVQGKSDRVKISTYKTYRGQFHGRNWWSVAERELSSEKDNTICTTITVAIDRGSEAIAKDIKRRLLPSAALIAGCAEKLIVKHTQDTASIAEFAKRFVAGVPGSSVVESSQSETYSRTIWVPGSVYECTISNYEGHEKVAFRVSAVPVDLAIEFLSKLQQRKQTTA